MQIKIKTVEGEEKVVDMRQPTGREVKQIRNKLVEIQKKAEKDQEITGIVFYLDYLDSIAVKCGKVNGEPLTIEFLDDLPQNEKEKVTSIVGVAAFGELDFSKLFGKQLN